MALHDRDAIRGQDPRRRDRPQGPTGSPRPYGGSSTTRSNRAAPSTERRDLRHGISPPDLAAVAEPRGAEVVPMADALR